MVYTLKRFGSIYLQSVHTAEDNIFNAHSTSFIVLQSGGGGADSSLVILNNPKHLVKKEHITFFSISICNIKELSGWAWELYPCVITYQARKDESKYDEYEPRKNI